jgi:hypothetical protein
MKGNLPNCETVTLTAMTSDQNLYNELAFYTLQLGDSAFIHQHIVDAYAVQYAGPDTKPIGIVFGLIGLYLHVEKNFTGRQVQRAHMKLAQHRKHWIAPPIPKQLATIDVADVLAAEPGPARHAMIRRWCEAVWQDWHESRAAIVALAQSELEIAP